MILQRAQIYLKQQAARAQISGSFSKQDQVLFAKRLSFLMRAGVPILDGLKLIQTQTRGKAGRAVFGQVTNDVSGGQFLSTALAKHRKLFGEFAINIIRVGETVGKLPENLNYLAEELKKKQALRKLVLSALFYPVFIVAATLGIVVLLTTIVFPKVLPIFASLNVPLPVSTKILIVASHIFLSYGWFILLVFVLLAIGFARAFKNRQFKKAIDRLALGFPLAGSLFQNYYLANFCRTMGLLLKAESRLNECLNIAARTSENLVYRQEFENMAGVVNKGERISEYMGKNPALFPAMIAHMLAVGETAGNLSETFLYLAEMYEQEVDDLTRNLSSLIEPVLMLFMGLLVGFVAISIITPIYSITQKLHP